MNLNKKELNKENKELLNAIFRLPFVYRKNKNCIDNIFDNFEHKYESFKNYFDVYYFKIIYFLFYFLIFIFHY